ncbi:L,D-transpeptidase catalytic domain [Filimonas lacunae]|uniref:L,D-transpeptidase catalytic domain n=1 Tax=Filimonas lacunae TaxID=477680 RepID=A0A173MEG5_9BACT|nr:murein L,D-transpeptidase catalytic domain family protein [Filimonas lacunae]BAV05828.1 hypothetical protein FLA_1840 [Filimonas lacunae]SIT28457.1 L,D-transpeptidase catalytic domain [Filimonas lacunae]
MPKFLSGILAIVMLCGIWCACTSHASENNKKLKKEAAGVGVEITQLKQHAKSVSDYIRKNGFNTRFCFLVNMSKPSGSNRFYVYNLEKDSVEVSGLVAHGRCNENWLEGRKYSNVNGSGCTSLGRYKIGKPYHGQWGLAYKLYGLDATNSNAFNRYVVLHSHTCVPANEVAPDDICQSDGCPTVAPAFLAKLAKKLDASSKPVLLYIYQ